MTDPEGCAAMVSEPPHHFYKHRCTRPAKEMFQGVPVCGVHLRVAKKWDEQNRFLSMAHHWWKISPR